MYINKDSSVREAGLHDQPRDQLLPDNDTRVQKADEWILCDGNKDERIPKKCGD